MGDRQRRERLDQLSTTCKCNPLLTYGTIYKVK
jgi:hypothetical protein